MLIIYVVPRILSVGIMHKSRHCLLKRAVVGDGELRLQGFYAETSGGRVDSLIKCQLANALLLLLLEKLVLNW